MAYTSEAWATQLRNPQSPVERIRPAIEQLGGKIACMYYAFGEYDLVPIAEWPDNVTASAFSLAATAGGAVKAIKTTPLLAIEEGLEAMRKASGAGYRPPGS